MIDHYPFLFYYFTILYLFFEEDLEEGQKVSEGEQKDLRRETNGLMEIPKRNSPSFGPEDQSHKANDSFRAFV